MKDFDLHIPTKIYFGRNIFKESLLEEKERLTGNLLVVTTGRSLYKLGYIQELIETLKRISINVFVWDDIDANPKVEQVEKAILYGMKNNCKIVIGFGGGSALDAAKAVAVGIGCRKPINNFMFDGDVPTKDTLPIIAIPTTAGTGSELSRGAILTSTDRMIKTGIRGEYICPVVAIVDSYFTEKIPESVTIDTGFDIFAHAFESFISKKANSYSEMLSLEAIKLVVKNLPLLKNNLDCKDARKNMAYASMIMGMNLASVGTALPHRMQYPIGARTDTSHGAGLFALYPAWIKHEYRYNSEKINIIAGIISSIQSFEFENSIDCILQFLELISNNKKLSDLGIRESDILEMVKDVSGNISVDPVSEEDDIIEKIYKESF